MDFRVYIVNKTIKDKRGQDFQLYFYINRKEICAGLNSNWFVSVFLVLGVLCIPSVQNTSELLCASDSLPFEYSRGKCL